MRADSTCPPAVHSAAQASFDTQDRSWHPVSRAVWAHPKVAGEDQEIVAAIHTPREHVDVGVQVTAAWAGHQFGGGSVWRRWF